MEQTLELLKQKTKLLRHPVTMTQVKLLIDKIERGDYTPKSLAFATSSIEVFLWVETSVVNLQNPHCFVYESVIHQNKFKMLTSLVLSHPNFKKSYISIKLYDKLDDNGVYLLANLISKCKTIQHVEYESYSDQTNCTYFLKLLKNIELKSLLFKLPKPGNGAIIGELISSGSVDKLRCKRCHFNQQDLLDITSALMSPRCNVKNLCFNEQSYGKEVCERFSYIFQIKNLKSIQLNVTNEESVIIFKGDPPPNLNSLYIRNISQDNVCVDLIKKWTNEQDNTIKNIVYSGYDKDSVLYKSLIGVYNVVDTLIVNNEYKGKNIKQMRNIFILLSKPRSNTRYTQNSNIHKLPKEIFIQISKFLFIK
jgi:hypothetical protein